MQFAAIDFETANHRSDSPCQVAVVIVEEGTCVAEHSWLIRPRELYFSERCIAVHGIRPQDVKHEPEWDVVWRELEPHLRGRVLVAHNAGFDVAVLMATMQAYGLGLDRYEFQCTRLIARRCWPGRTGYGLHPTATALGITFQHHVAVEDARTCAQIAIAAARETRALSLASLERNLAIQRGFFDGERRVQPRSVRRLKSHAQTSPRGKLPVAAILEECGGERPLDGKRVHLTGSLFGLDHSHGIEFLEALGAIVEANPKAKTDYWIVGTSSERGEVGQATSNLVGRDWTVDTASSTKILSPRQLLALLPGAAQLARRMYGNP